MSKRRIFTIIFFTIILLSIVGCSNNSPTTSSLPVTDINQSFDKSLSGELKVHFLDVGQADSIVVQMPDGQNMLIDAGNNDDGNTVVNYLNQSGIKQIDYLIGTHPHEDHIGGLDTVIQSFDIGKIYMPRVSHTSKTFEDVLMAAQEKRLKITPAKAGVEIINNGEFTTTILAPNNSSYEDLNNYSAVLKITFDKISFLLTGDAEELSESEMLKSGANLKADVLKVGHHGSHSSTSLAFFSAVNPKYAVICVGTGNDYGHPHRETLQTLSNIKVYRTDLNGTIVFNTDGQEIKVITGKQQSSLDTATSANTTNNTEKLYVDANGQGLIKGNINSKGERIYHLPGGANYDRTNPEMWFKTEAEAQAAGFRPTKR